MTGRAANFGSLQFVQASQAGGWTLSIVVYLRPASGLDGETLCGPGVEAVSMYARENTCTPCSRYADRMPAEVWYGRPDVPDSTARRKIHFEKKSYTWTPPSKATIGSATPTR